jgi:hypothetical protein
MRAVTAERIVGEQGCVGLPTVSISSGVKVTHAIADALLLAEYCRRVHRGIR